MSSKPLALLSVSDKRELIPFARGLVDRGWEITSTGGTARALRESGIEVLAVAELTGHPEMMDGRVKTLHPAVHAGILSRGTEADRAALGRAGYREITLVAVNLYPFRETVAAGDVPVDRAMEQVDIGGPSMIRAAAKNHARVWPVVDPGDYPAVLAGIDSEAHADVEVDLRRTLAAKVFAHVSEYDAAISGYLGVETRAPVEGSDGAVSDASAAEGGADRLTLGFELLETLRYGENPDQTGSFWAPAGHRSGIAALEQLHGKALSYNNILDLDGALLALSPFQETARAAVSVIKHTTPCGLAVADRLDEAFERALETDPVSAFGSIIACNRDVDLATAERIGSMFVECVVAPGFDDDAFEHLARKKNLRLLRAPGGTRISAGPGGGGAGDQMRTVSGGLLRQSAASAPAYLPTDPADLPEGWRSVAERAPSAQEWDDLRFAWAAVFSVKSNAILLARDGATVGIGAGQMSRVDSSRLAVTKALGAGLATEGSVLASDAFFPFRDGVDAAAEAGVTAIVQPGGSIRDEEVVEAAREHGLAMVFTGRRLFRH